MQVGAGAAAEIAAALDKMDAKAGLGESAGRAHSGDAAAENDGGLVGRVLLGSDQELPQGLKPKVLIVVCGTTKVVP